MKRGASRLVVNTLVVLALLVVLFYIILKIIGRIVPGGAV